MFRKDIRTTGRHGIDEQRFAIKFTRYEGSDMPKDRLRELEALKDMSGSENILAQFACEHVYVVCVRGRLVLMSVFGLEIRREIHFCLSTS